MANRNPLPSPEAKLFSCLSKDTASIPDFLFSQSAAGVYAMALDAPLDAERIQNDAETFRQFMDRLRLVKVNRKFIESCGLDDSGRLLGKPLRSLLPSEAEGLALLRLLFRNATEPFLKNLMGTAQPRAKAGCACWLNSDCLPVFDDQGLFVGFIGLVSEKGSGTTAWESPDEILWLHRFFCESTKDLLFCIRVEDNGAFVIEYLNAQAAAVIQKPKSELEGKRVEEIFSEKNTGKVLAQYRRCIAEGKTITYEEDPVVATGQYHFRTMLSPVRDRSGRITRLFGISQDQTELRALGLSTLKAKQLESLGILASGIAHDFNNILSVMLGFTELSLESESVDKEVRRNLQHVIKTGRRAKDLVQRILAFGKSEGGEYKPVRLQDIVTEAYHFLRESIPANFQVTVQTDSDCPMIFGDQVQLHQMIVNLGINAYHAMCSTALPSERPKDLRLGLRSVVLKTSPDDTCEFIPGVHAEVTVSDTGTGIPADVLDHIFEPYFTTKDAGFGTGLGLPIVYGVVKSHKGFITVKTDTGKGTTFTICLPVLQGARDEKAAVAAAQPALSLRGNERVLLVDDEVVAAGLYEHTLKSYGYKVSKCTSAEEALDRFETDPDRHQILVTDLTMPVKSGLDISERVLAIRPDTPIVLFTGFGTEAIRTQTEKLGIKHMLQKPFPVEELVKAIRMSLDESTQAKRKGARR